ncbi:hypothetical protein BG004_007645 [Podila humilis]|nr:hypothetical protein BG004_007645 [Podila humilis]
MYQGYEWHGRRIEVREDKFGPPAGGSGRAPSPRRYDSASKDSYRQDYGRGGNSGNSGRYGDSYGSSNTNNASNYSGSNRHDDYRSSSDRHSSDRDRHHHSSGSHDNYGSSSRQHYGDSSMHSIPSGPAAGSGDQIYVRNLPLTTTDTDLKDLFRSCGQILMTEILVHNGRPKGSGIVRFQEFESADKAVAKFNGWIYGGRSLEVVYDRV